MSNHKQDERSDNVANANILWWKNKEEERAQPVKTKKRKSNFKEQEIPSNCFVL